jgi:uncharacterized sporulation protein YeaH/YhbH (DUF444 family)
MDIVDRRLNPKAKSLGNRQWFLRGADVHMIFYRMEAS